jgi:hypothetical protein
LKTLWILAAAVLLGPFPLWFILDGKLRRRGLLPGYTSRFLASAALFLAYHALLFAAPVHWMALLGLHVAASLASAIALSRPSRAVWFAFPTDQSPAERPPVPFSDCLVAVAMAVLPLVYMLALAHDIGELGAFSIRLPSEVYTSGFLWMAYAAPFAALAAFLAWRWRFRPTLRALVYFQGSVLVVAAWIMVWERLDQSLVEFFGIQSGEPLLFAYEAEQAWRFAVKTAFYLGGFLLGTAFLVGAARTSAFGKRALFLGLPSLLLYANMLFAMGDWNSYLTALREGAYALHRFDFYRYAAMAQLARTPAAYWAPYLREERMELAYQSGDIAGAKALMERIARDGRRWAYHAGLGRKAERSLQRLAAAARAGGAGEEPVLLDLPVIKPASYLQPEWYGLLAAVAYLKPDWTDLEMRKRLLDLSSTVQLQLPRLDNIPELVPAFRLLDVPATACFLTRERLLAALRAGKVPYVVLHGSWVPVSGYDPGRDGFYFHFHPGNTAGTGLFRNEDLDLFQHAPGESFGGQRDRSREKRARSGSDPRYSIRKFIPADELERHVLDIGGVGLVLGDSAFVGPEERRAAYLVEQGDVHYQEHDNYQEAAACYLEAARLFPHDQIASRMLYLKRRYELLVSDARDHRNLFRAHPPAWMEGIAMPPAEEKALKGRIMEGRLGTYLLMNWHAPAEPDPGRPARESLDSSIALFSTLRRLDPHEPSHVDSLASLLARAGDLAASAGLYDTLMSMHPFGNEYAAYRMAWVKFGLGKLGEMEEALALCEGFADDARYLTMQGALALERGREGKAYRLLSRSLKLDKGLGETHRLLAEYHGRRGEREAEAVHLQWLKRST